MGGREVSVGILPFPVVNLRGGRGALAGQSGDTAGRAGR